MAILKIYKTNLDPTRNMVLDNIEDYLANVAQEVYVDSYFQFIRPALQQTIKINAKTFYNDISLIKIANFLSITEKATNNENAEEVTYYYFIMGAEWVADGTCRLTIALDTLNTWWDDIKSNITDKTHITREHKNRFGKKEQEFLSLEYDYQGYLTQYTPNSYTMSVELQDDAWIGASQAELVTMNTNRSDLTGTFTRLNEIFDSTTGTYSFTLRYVGSINNNIYLTIRGDIQFGFPQFYYRVIDKFSEGLQPVTFGENKGEVEGDNNNWYLIYGAPKDGQGVVDKAYMRMCPKYPVNVYVPGHSTITPGTAPLTDNGYYYIVPEYGQGVYCILTTNTGTEYKITGNWGGNPAERNIAQLEVIGSSLRVRAGYRAKNEAGGNIHWYTSWETCSSIEVTNTAQVTFYYLDRNSSNIDTVLNGGQRTISITGGNYQISSIDTIKRYASSLVKIIELPYSVIKSNGVTKEWSAVEEGGYTYLETIASTQLESYITSNYNPLSELTVDLSSVTDRDENNILNESKLYHSDFYQPKFVYDSFTKTFALERQNINREALYAPFRINFKATNTINSRFLFDFTKYDTDGQALEDYENILVVNRNNELPLYNDEYLNYLRTGYNYDIKAKNTQIATAAGSATLSLAGSAASIAIASTIGGASTAGVAGMVVGAAVGVVGAITSIVSQTQLQTNSIQQKEAQYANQAMSVRGSDDVDLLNYYSNNKAKMMLYKPSEQMTNAIYNMLRLSGYACDEYKIPQFNTRIWYNFVQCEPTFLETNNKIYQNFLDEIKNRFQLGVTVFHERNNSWDLSQEKENYEAFLFN